MIINILILLIAVIVLGIHTYTVYYEIFYSKNKFSFSSPNKNFRFFKLSLSSGGALVPYGNGVPNNDPINEGVTTVVELTDAELNELLQIVFAEIGNSNLISVELLQSLGLYTDTVVSLLTALGYIIF